MVRSEFGKYPKASNLAIDSILTNSIVYLYNNAFFVLHAPSEVRISIEQLDRWGKPGLLLELEAILLRATEPPYNVKIPMER